MTRNVALQVSYKMRTRIRGGGRGMSPCLLEPDSIQGLMCGRYDTVCGRCVARSRDGVSEIVALEIWWDELP